MEQAEGGICTNINLAFSIRAESVAFISSRRETDQAPEPQLSRDKQI